MLDTLSMVYLRYLTNKHYACTNTRTYIRTHSKFQMGGVATMAMDELKGNDPAGFLVEVS